MIGQVAGIRVVIVWPPEPVRRTFWERLKSRPFQSHTPPGDSLRWNIIEANGGGIVHDGVLYCTQDFYGRLKKFSPLPPLEKP